MTDFCKLDSRSDDMFISSSVYFKTQLYPLRWCASRATMHLICWFKTEFCFLPELKVKSDIQTYCYKPFKHVHVIVLADIKFIQTNLHIFILVFRYQLQYNPLLTPSHSTLHILEESLLNPVRQFIKTKSRGKAEPDEYSVSFI